jgi:menaquinol-cytochrome c reductase iron-sulfur subunit
MERRTFLRWAVHGLGAVFGAVLGVPAVVYLIDPRNRPAPEREFQTVAKLSDLTEDVPKEVVIRATRRDAWTLHPDEVVGRIWLVRKGPAQVDAFNTTCPHLGCSINFTGSGFLCPCHGGHFSLDGDKEPGSNPAPRNMDSLETVLVPIAGIEPADFSIRVRYQKFKTNQPQKEVDA